MRLAKRVEGNTGQMVTQGSYVAKVLLDESGYRDQGVEHLPRKGR